MSSRTPANRRARIPGKAANASGGGLDYESAGVDVAAGNALVERIKPLCEKTTRPEVVGGIGGFAGLFKLAGSKYRTPVLVAATDGVGTKLKLAGELGVHEHVGVDLVAMCVNDVLAHGAEPLFFLDYLACGKLSVDAAAAVVAGIATGCEAAGCALIGGETAEMPGMYADGDYDLAGFAVGVAEEDALCGAHRVENGDAVVALASSGVHANGFSLVRKIISETGADLGQPFGGGTLGETLLAPTRIYVEALLPAVTQGRVRALAHVTGGGMSENLPRMIGPDQAIDVNLGSWTRPAIFEWIRRAGGIGEPEMLRVFNCGVGMAAAVAPEQTGTLIRQLKDAGVEAWQLGEVVPRRGRAPVRYAA